MSLAILFSALTLGPHLTGLPLQADGIRETIGGGDIAHPAVGAAPSYAAKVGRGFVLVKNWKFGSGGTVRNANDLIQEFDFHDQFGTIANGTNYGAVIVAPNAETALAGTMTGPQPVEDPRRPVRAFTVNSLKTFLVPLNGAAECSPAKHNVGCGSFMAKWKLANGGSLLGKDILWETRVKMVTPPYFWFAIWNAGNIWDQGAEIDLIESFGWDNGGSNTNYDAKYWHSNSIGNVDEVNYATWPEAMAGLGITKYDATEYHVWQLLYRKDDTFSCYVDGREVQHGSRYYWTVHHEKNGKPISFDFLFDAGWGHNQVSIVNHPLPPSAFTGKFYEWNYSRVYLR